MSASRTNHILAIGINKYKHESELHNPVDDCKKIIDILCKRYQFEKKHVREIYDEDATRENILTALEAYRDLTDEDNLLIIYSGHGQYDKRGNAGYWIPVDAKSFTNYISAQDLKTQLRAYKAHHVALIVDSCFSGALLSRAIVVRKKKKLDNPAAVKLDKRKSRWAITSGRVELVFDGNAGENSPFARSILSELKYNEKEMLLLSELGVKAKEITNRNADQTPSCSFLRDVNDEAGEFSFVLKDFTPPEIPDEPDEIADRKIVRDVVTKGTEYVPESEAVSEETELEQLKKELRKLFVKQKVKEAYELLIEKLDEDSSHKTTAYLRLAGLNGLDNEIVQGIAVNIPQRRAQINHALDYIIKNLEADDLAKS